MRRFFWPVCLLLWRGGGGVGEEGGAFRDKVGMFCFHSFGSSIGICHDSSFDGGR